MSLPGMDVGSTFTDLVLFDSDIGSVAVHKVPSPPQLLDSLEIPWHDRQSVLRRWWKGVTERVILPNGLVLVPLTQVNIYP